MADAAAIPYAEAIYSAAKDAGRLREVSRGLTSFVQSLDESPELDGLLANPAFPLDRKRTVIEEVTKSDEPLLTRSLTVLMSNGRYALVRDVQAVLADRVRRDERELAVELTTAVVIDDAQADDVRKKIEAATGFRVEMTRRVDPAIMGGVVLRVRDTLVDASILRRFDALKLQMSSAKLSA